MSTNIKKLDFDAVIQSKKGFTTVLNDVVQNIPCAFTLGLYVYLSSLPTMWKINRVQLMKHFNVGRDKLHNALRWLNENELISHHQDRLANGTVDKSVIVVHEGWEFLKKISVKQASNTAILKTSKRLSAAILKNRTTEKPDSGKTAPINTTFIRKTKKDKGIFFDKNKKAGTCSTVREYVKPPEIIRANPETVNHCLDSLPINLQPKRLKNKDPGQSGSIIKDRSTLGKFNGKSEASWT